MSEPDVSFIMCVRVSSNITPVAGSTVDNCARCNAEVWLAPESRVGNTLPGVTDGAKFVLADVPNSALIACSSCVYKQAMADGDTATATLVKRMATSVGEVVGD